jgi:hypothetical protein
MKKGLFLLIIVLFCQCQYKFRLPKDAPPIPKIREIVLECGLFGTMTVEERRRTFPFNEAVKVLLISFQDFRSENEPKFKPKAINITETTTPWGELLPLVNSIKKKAIVDTFNIFDRAYLAYEVVQLNQEQIDSLSHLLFNYLPKKRRQTGTFTIKGCYNPRNCILFFDKKNKPIFNMEICFECGNMYYYPSFQGLSFDNMDCRKIEVIKPFFKQCNVHYGVDSLKN